MSSESTLHLYLDTDYFTAKVVATLFLIFFIVYIIPKLPDSIIASFDNTLVKLLIFVAVAYAAKQNPTVGIIMAVCLIVILNTVNQRKTERMIGNIIASVKHEHMEVPAIENIRNLDMQNLQRLQGYPLMDSENANVVQLNPGSVKNIQQETKIVSSCDQKMKYKNEFYPQYTDLPQDEYSARSNLISSKGYDETCIANDAYPQSSGDTYLESNDGAQPNPYNVTCGYASV
jgi:hypothetical protein